MKQSESDIQNAIIEALVFDGWLVIRINQGGRGGKYKCPYCDNYVISCGVCNTPISQSNRYTRFAFWQALGIESTDKGIADVIAVKSETRPLWTPSEFRLLAIECKATGKKGNVSKAQRRFLDEVEDHGGIAIVADCLEDIQEYLDRAVVQ